MTQVTTDKILYMFCQLHAHMLGGWVQNWGRAM